MLLNTVRACVRACIAVRLRLWLRLHLQLRGGDGAIYAHDLQMHFVAAWRIILAVPKCTRVCAVLQ